MLRLRAAEAADVPAIFELIGELARIDGDRLPQRPRPLTTGSSSAPQSITTRSPRLIST